MVSKSNGRNVEHLEEENDDLDEQDLLENDHLGHQEDDREVLLYRGVGVFHGDLDGREQDHEQKPDDEELVQIIEAALGFVHDEVDEHVEDRNDHQVLDLVVGRLQEEDFGVQHEKIVEDEQEHQDHWGQVFPEQSLESDVESDIVGLLHVQVADRHRHDSGLKVLFGNVHLLLDVNEDEEDLNESEHQAENENVDQIPFHQVSDN